MTSYEQLEFDIETRKDLTIAVGKLIAETISNVQEMIQSCCEAPEPVRNRHEAYGIATEHYAKIADDAKAIKGDLAILLGTLSDPNFPALEATSSICNSMAEATVTMIIAAAEMRRTLYNLYIAERIEEKSPIEEYIENTAEFEDAESTDESEE